MLLCSPQRALGGAVCEGVMILASPPGKFGGVPMEFRQPSEDQMTYQEVRNQFELHELISESDSDQSESEEEGDDEYEIEMIVSHRIVNDGTIKYRVRWMGYDYRSDNYKTEEELQGCQQLLEEYKQAQGDGIPDPGKMMTAMSNIEEGIRELKRTTEEYEVMVMAVVEFEDEQVQVSLISEYQATYMAGSDMLEDEQIRAMSVTEVKLTPASAFEHMCEYRHLVEMCKFRVNWPLILYFYLA